MMRSVKDTMARLKSLVEQRAASPLDIVPGRLDEFTAFGANPGALGAYCYVPDRASALVVVLHGCTQTAAGYDQGAGWSKLAERFGFALLFPEQCRPNNPNLCFNWFQPENSRRGQGEALSIRQMIATC